MDYQRARAAGTLDEIAPNPSADCKQCGERIPPGRRWGAEFCSVDCKQAWTDAHRHREQVRKENPGRSCAWCQGPIDAGKRSGTLLCSQRCKTNWKNARRQAVKRAAWMATNPVCQRQQCGKPIPESRPRWSKYCSPECKKKEMDARWRARSPHYNRQYLYGISQEQYEAAMIAQGGRCAICGTTEWMGKDQRPHTDHDRVTRAFRGILCMECNIGIGKLGHDPARLRAAADYLERAAVLV